MARPVFAQAPAFSSGDARDAGQVTMQLGPLSSVELAVYGLDPSGGPGAYGYSWILAQQAFMPVLERLAPVCVLDRPESRLDYWARDVRRRGKSPIAFSFLPFQDAYFSRAVPTINYCFWEFPDIPREPLWGNPRYDWARLAAEPALIVCGSTAAAEAFRKAGVKTPTRVVPPPLPAHWLAPADARPLIGIDTAETPAVLPRMPPFGHDRERWRRLLFQRLEYWTLTAARRITSPRLYAAAKRVKGAVVKTLRALRGAAPVAPPPPPKELVPIRAVADDVLFTAVCNPLDGRKAWQDVLTSFMHVLGDRADATLVLKFVCAPNAADEQLAEVRRRVRAFNHRSPRCRVVVKADQLDDSAMRSLAESTTWYVNGTRAEGCCLPLLEMMAAARPALSPTHTAMSDYFSDRAGLVLECDESLTDWPGGPTGRMQTTWMTPRWPSLCRAFDQAYRLARHDRDGYARLAAGAAAAARSWAGPDAVEARLRAAVAAVLPKAAPVREAA